MFISLSYNVQGFVQVGWRSTSRWYKSRIIIQRLNFIQMLNSKSPVGTTDETSTNVEAMHVTPNLNKTNVVRSALIKSWVVRSSAFSIQCGGLERLFIHFSKPKFFYEKLTDKDMDMPFGDISIQEGYFKKAGWHNTHKTWVNTQSVGNWLGYQNPISDFIWSELSKHFLNEPIEKWHILEKEGKSNIEDFCLEIDLCVTIG